MPDWMSPEEIARDASAFGKFLHVLLGLYIWEWFTSLGFDWQFISGAKPFRWPLIFYFLNRYCLLFALIGITISLNVSTPIDCQSLYTFNQCVGNASIGLASINLSLRTMAVWSQKYYVVIPLVIVILGHWSFLLHGILLKAQYFPGQGCVITQTDSKILAITFIYTMVFDFVVLCLTAYKLFLGSGQRSKLIELVFKDGLIYFVIAFLGNMLATVFMLLNLNPVMSIIANVPAAIASTIVACRAVRRLLQFTSTSGVERFASSTQGSTLAFRTSPSTASANKRAKASKSIEGMQMDTFESPAAPSYVEYDAAGRIVTSETFDPEAQVISDEFKRPPY
ncbi:hypothetical protein DL96DRAFT_1597609 [Flagelloscypha sp. PMI_526]|nr:hypothetical protein DL96DRAFT_1597609 [Flagelloscypha sp. PMI_526]